MSFLNAQFYNVTEKVAYGAAALTVVAGIGYGIWSATQPNSGLPEYTAEDFRASCNETLSDTEWNRVQTADPLAQTFTVAVDQSALQNCMDENLGRRQELQKGAPMQIVLNGILIGVFIAAGGAKLGERRQRLQQLSPTHG